MGVCGYLQGGCKMGKNPREESLCQSPVRSDSPTGLDSCIATLVCRLAGGRGSTLVRWSVYEKRMVAFGALQ